ncbi:hypothetical protein [Roseivivax sp. CAU 1761]
MDDTLAALHEAGGCTDMRRADLGTVAGATESFASHSATNFPIQVCTNFRLLA